MKSLGPVSFTPGKNWVYNLRENYPPNLVVLANKLA